MCSKKLLYLMSAVFVLGLWGNASAADRWWSGAAGTAWNDAGNWWEARVPTIRDNAFLDTVYSTTLIDSSMAAKALSVHVGEYNSALYLNMTGGTLEVANDMSVGVLQHEWGYGSGEVDFYGGTMSIGGNLNVCLNGWWGLFNMKGGTCNVTGTVYVPAGTDTLGAKAVNGELYLHGGVLNCNNFIRSTGGTSALVDIVAGQMIINGDHAAYINQGVTDGWITGYSGLTGVLCDYGVTNAGKTTVRAQGSHFTNAGGNQLWSNAANWINGVPTGSTFAGIVVAGTTCLVNSTVTADCNKLIVGYFNTGAVTISVTGGTLTTASDWIVGATTNSQGVVNATGGVINIGGNFSVVGPSSSVDVNGATIKLNGDQRSTVLDYQALNVLKAKGGSGKIVFDYDETNAGKTTLVGVTPVDHTWNSTVVGDKWNTAGKWTQGTLPDKPDTAYINIANANCLIDSTVSAVCDGLQVGKDTTGSTLNITGGTLRISPYTTPSNVVIGNLSTGSGTVTMSGGTVTAKGGVLVGNQGTGTLNMSGGTLTISKTLAVPGAMGTGTITLSGGTIYAGDDNPNAGLDMSTGTGLINVTSGTLVVTGDLTARVKEYMAKGKLVAYSGRGSIVYNYNVTNSGKTTITAVSENGVAYTPSPSAGATEVSASPTLTWTRGDWAAATGGHRVFLGTSFDDVNNATTGSPQYKGTVDSASYSASGLVAGQTYYWRIDEVNGSNPNSPWKGNIWSFEVARPANFRTVFNFNNNWRYYRGNITNDNAKNTSFDDYGWTAVSVPHSWRTVAYDAQWPVPANEGIGWYRKSFTVPSAYSGKKVFIDFEAVDNKAWVWINGTQVSSHQGTVHKGAFLPFTVDVTNYITFGSTNVLAVKADNTYDSTIPEYSRWQSYGGISRNIRMRITDKLHLTDAVDANLVASGGIFVSFSSVSSSSATVQVKSHVKNENTASKNCYVNAMLLDANGVAVAGNASTIQAIAAGGNYQFTQSFTVSNPHLWEPNSPYLYTAVVEVYDSGAGTHVDGDRQQVGIKTISFSHATGFSINGKKLLWTGANRTQDFAWVGNNMSDFQQKLDGQRMRDCGFQHFRSSSYPQSPAFLDMCDKLGILVEDAIAGFHYYSAGAFEQQSYRDMRDLIRRDRNRAGIVLWELSLNESSFTTTYAQNAVNLGHAEIPQPPNYVCGWDFDTVYDVYIRNSDHYPSARDYTGTAPLVIDEHGHWGYGGAESTSDALRGQGEVAMLQQAWNHQDSLHRNRVSSVASFLCGDDIWVFNDMVGYASGVTDKNRLPKFSYYFWQSQRDPNLVLADANSGPMVFIANYWTANSPRDVRVFSNCDQVKLYINGVSQGTQNPDANDANHPTNGVPHPSFTFANLTFASGELKAEGLIGGQVKATHIVNTPGSAAALNVSFDTKGYAVTANGGDMVFVHASVLDNAGTLVPTAANAVTITLAGPATMVSPAVRNAEAGIASFMIRTLAESGTIKVTATASGLTSGNNTLAAVPWTDLATWFATLPDNTAPTPDPMTFATNPSAASDTSITMTATTASDASGVEYYFHETTGHAGASDSGWQDSVTYTDTGLSPNTLYTYQVKARDKSVNHNETAYSTTQSATTYQIVYPGSYVVSVGTYGSGTVANLQVDDTSYLVINSTTVSPRTATTDFTVTGITVTSPTQVVVRTVAKSSQSATTQTVYLWNYTTSAWDSKDSATVGTSEVIRDITVSSGISNYISGGQMKVRVNAVKNTKAFAYSHDQIMVTIKP